MLDSLPKLQGTSRASPQSAVLRVPAALACLTVPQLAVRLSAAAGDVQWAGAQRVAGGAPAKGAALLDYTLQVRAAVHVWNIVF